MVLELTFWGYFSSLWLRILSLKAYFDACDFSRFIHCTDDSPDPSLNYEVRLSV